MMIHHLRFDDQRCRFTNRRRTMITLTLCAAVIVATIGPAQAMVICVGADGHIGVEMALDSCCSTLEAQKTPFGPSVTAASHGCQDCTDLRLSTSMKPSASQRFRSLCSRSSAVSTSTALALSSAHWATQREYSVPPSPPVLGILATIILLI